MNSGCITLSGAHRLERWTVPSVLVPKYELWYECHCPVLMWVMYKWKLVVRVGSQDQAGKEYADRPTRINPSERPPLPTSS